MIVWNRFLFSNINDYSTNYYWFSFDYDAPYNTSRDDDDDDDDEDEDPKNCSKISQNRVCCSLGYMSTYIGTTNFREKVLWV